MDRIKAHFDKFLVILAGLVLAGTAAFVVLAAGKLGEEFAPPALREQGTPFAPEARLAQLRADREQMDRRPVWQARGENSGSLFVSRVYLLRDGNLVDVLQSDTELFPGIANAWLIEHDLDYTDPGLPAADPDGDGFTNLEEFLARTDPRDPQAKPAVWTKLRLVGSKIDKLRVKFMSLPTGSLEEVSINTISADNPQELSGSTRFYRAGDKIVVVERGPDGNEIEQPTPLVFERAEIRREFNPSTNVEEDVPFSYLRNTADDREIALRRGEVKDSPYSLATLRDTRPGGPTMELRSGETFTLDERETYKLIDVTEEKAIIQELESGEQHEVPSGGQPPADSVPMDNPSE
jgi:hypothetical protein